MAIIVGSVVALVVVIAAIFIYRRKSRQRKMSSPLNEPKGALNVASPKNGDEGRGGDIPSRATYYMSVEGRTDELGWTYDVGGNELHSGSPSNVPFVTTAVPVGSISASAVDDRIEIAGPLPQRWRREDFGDLPQTHTEARIKQEPSSVKGEVVAVAQLTQSLSSASDAQREVAT